MFKTISAALLAVSVLAAPAFAASSKTTQAPVIKPTQTQATPANASARSTVKSTVKPSVLNANAKMSKHHVKHVRHDSHHNKKMAAQRTHAKVSLKHTVHTSTKRG